MSNRRWFHVAVSGVLLPSLFLLIVLLVVVFAAGQQTAQAMPAEPAAPEVPAGSAAQVVQQPAATTVLSVTILSSPWATLDNTDPDGSGKNAPRAMVVEARVANMGTVSATDVTVDLDFNEDPANGWQLLSNERRLRTLSQLDAGSEYYAYWFATYTSTYDVGHTYTVTASAANAAPVSTSDNFFGNPEPGKTVKTRSVQSTGNNGLSLVNANVVVGVAFTVTTDYDLGQNPVKAGFSPVGNLDFDPGAFRLLATQVRFYNDAGTQQSTVGDRVYFPTLPAFADNAEATYTFIAVRPAPTRLCPYTTVDYSQNPKYDNAYCSDNVGAVVEVTGTVGLSLTKQVNSGLVQQGEPLTYTIDYTNTGDLPMVTVWVWDDVNPNQLAIQPATIDPAPDAGETTDSRVAWYLGTIPPPPNAGYADQLSFRVLVDGNGADLADGTEIVNEAFFGINDGALPPDAAYTATVTTTVQAPTIEVVKQASSSSVTPGDPLTFTVQITNSGSVTATGVVVTDVLPAGVTYVSGTPEETARNGQSLVWNNVGPIPPSGNVNLTLQVTVNTPLADGTQLTNTVTVAYQNPAGYVYTPKQADVTVAVNGPTLAISKQAHVETVLAGRPLTYTLTYTNSGAGTANNVTVTDTVPANTTFVSCSGGTLCGEASGVVQWNLEPIAGGAGGSLSFTVLTDAGLATDSYIENDDYGVHSDETGLITGPTVSTRVVRNAAIIDGYTFVDDGNGQFDPGDSPLAGVTVTLPVAITPTLLSDVDGYFRFVVESEQAISVTAGLPSGYFRTTPGTIITYTVFEVTQTVGFGYATTGEEFGSIFGTVFNDANRNGVQDVGELGIQGVTLTLDGLETTQTDLYGTYSFSSTAPGLHTVVETDLDGYISTTPNEVHTVVTKGAGVEVNFGDLSDTSGYGTIYGTVFDDLNSNGQWDGDEPGIPGVTVTLDGGDSTVTGADGGYFFSTSADGVHVVTETDPSNYRSTTPNEVHVDVDLGNGYEVNFGDALDGEESATILGTVFEDSDGDGLFGANEVGLAGVTVTLDGTTTRVTDGYGGYSFPATAGVHTVVETDLPGYFSTTPNAVSDEVALGDTVEINFGDAPGNAGFAVLMGTVYEDANSNQQRDAGELGIAGVTVTLDGNATRTTDGQGRYSFKTTEAGSHTLVETDPFGYVSTTPNSVATTAVLNQASQVDFGDLAAGSVACDPDAYEPDNSSAGASPTDFNVTYDHDFCVGNSSVADQDWRAFSAQAGFEYTITTSSYGQRADTFVAIFDSNGTTLLAANDDYEGTTDFSSRVVWQAPSDGSYFIRTTNRAGLTGLLTGYEITVEVDEQYQTFLPIAQSNYAPSRPQGLVEATRSAAGADSIILAKVLSPNGVINHCGPDDFEIDDTWQGAKPIEPGVVQTHTFDSNPVVYAADKDFVWVDLFPGQTATFNVPSTSNTSTLLELYNKDGQALNVTGTDELSWTAVDGGRFYLSVSPSPAVYSCSGDVAYTLSLETSPFFATYLPIAQH